jgi:hypothetical protein
MEAIMLDCLVVYTKKIEVKNPATRIPSSESLSGALEWKMDDRFSYSFTDLKEGTYAIGFHGKGFVGEILVKNLIMHGVLEFDGLSKAVRVNGILGRKQTVSFFLLMMVMIAFPFIWGFSSEAAGVLLFVPLYFLNIYWIESRRFSKIAGIAAQQWKKRGSV